MLRSDASCEAMRRDDFSLSLAGNSMSSKLTAVKVTSIRDKGDVPLSGDTSGMVIKIPHERSKMHSDLTTLLSARPRASMILTGMVITLLVILKYLFLLVFFFFETGFYVAQASHQFLHAGILKIFRYIQMLLCVCFLFFKTGFLS